MSALLVVNQILGATARNQISRTSCFNFFKALSVWYCNKTNQFWLLVSVIRLNG